MKDFPNLAAFLFEEPDYGTEEARILKASLPSEALRECCRDHRDESAMMAANSCRHIGRVIQDFILRSEDGSASLPWNQDPLRDTLFELNAKSGLKQKEYMSILRYALTGKKVSISFMSMDHVLMYVYEFQTGLGVASTMRLLGRERTLARLRHVSV